MDRCPKSVRLCGNSNPIIVQMLKQTEKDCELQYKAYNAYSMKDGSHRFPKPLDALTKIMCPQVDINGESFFLGVASQSIALNVQSLNYIPKKEVTMNLIKYILFIT